MVQDCPSKIFSGSDLVCNGFVNIPRASSRTPTVPVLFQMSPNDSLNICNAWGAYGEVISQRITSNSPSVANLKLGESGIATAYICTYWIYPVSMWEIFTKNPKALFRSKLESH